MTASFQERFVDADGFRIRYWEAGAGPVLVHLHGSGGARVQRSHALLAEKHRVVVFEMPGFGASAEKTRSGSMAELATTMERAIGALGVARCTLLGTSFGGIVGLWLAGAVPRPAGRADPGRARCDPAAGAPAALRHGGGNPPPDLRLSRPGAGRTAARCRGRGEAARADQPPARSRSRSGADGAAAGDHGADVGGFGTLDSVIPPEMGREYKRLLPDCHLLFVYDAGHEIGAERPEAFVEAVTDFAARRATFVINQVATLKFP